VIRAASPFLTSVHGLIGFGTLEPSSSVPLGIRATDGPCRVRTGSVERAAAPAFGVRRCWAFAAL
jgi:hypothetical protein